MEKRLSEWVRLLPAAPREPYRKDSLHLPVDHYPRLEFVPLGQWNHEQAPMDTSLCQPELWSTRWDRCYLFSASLSFLIRSRGGLMIKEYFGLPGLIVPFAQCDLSSIHYYVFTLTGDPTYYYLGAEQMTVVHDLGTFETPADFWATASTHVDVLAGKQLSMVDPEAEKKTNMKFKQQRDLAGAIRRVKGDYEFNDIHAALADGQNWWDIFAADPKLSPILEHCKALVEEEKASMADLLKET